jgi:Tfp pilus assembly protein PilN
MMKINLLGVAPPPTAAAAVGLPLTRTFQVGVFVSSAVVIFAVVGFVYKLWSSAVKEEQDLVNKELLRQAELKDIKAKNDQYLAQLRDLDRINATIDALLAAKVGPVEEMTALGEVASRTNDVYLYSMSPQGDRVVLNGQSGSVDSMAAFLSSLEKSGYFQDVQLRKFFQDNQKERLTYKFTVDMVYKSPTAAGAAGQTAAPAGAAVPARQAGL